jgi:hypothetical protein
MYEVLVEEHKENFSGTPNGKNVWATVKRFTIVKFNYFMTKIEKDPKSLEQLDENYLYV